MIDNKNKVRDNKDTSMPLFAFRLVQDKLSRQRRVYNAVKKRIDKLKNKKEQDK